MMKPTFSNLKLLNDVIGRGPFGKWMVAGAVNRHPNPRFYKYYWWVFHAGSACEGSEFLGNAHRLNEYDAYRLMEALREADEAFMLYNRQLPRRGGKFDPDSAKWKSREWAPAFEDDPDPEHKGYK